jgi:hypothetical protein
VKKQPLVDIVLFPLLYVLARIEATHKGVVIKTFKIPAHVEANKLQRFSLTRNLSQRDNPVCCRR